MRLRELRKRRKISQLKLAMDLNMNQNTISRYETGEREADYKTLIAFADYFQVSIDYLLERTENPKMNNSKTVTKSLRFYFLSINTYYFLWNGQ